MGQASKPTIINNYNTVIHDKLTGKRFEERIRREKLAQIEGRL